MTTVDEIWIAVAAFADGPPELLDRIGDSWPVTQADLDAEVAKQAQIGGWTVLEVSEPERRGPHELVGVDPATGREYTYYRWQLAANVRTA